MICKIVFILSTLVLAASSPAFSSDQGWNFGFQNSDGSQDTFNTQTGWGFGFKNPDGSQDTFHAQDASWEFGFQNPDGSQDSFRTRGYGDYMTPAADPGELPGKLQRRE